MEINIDDLQEKLDESNAIKPPKSMNELMERIYQAGELWREEHKELDPKKKEWFGC
ncbi:protein of unknown function [Streptococcus thermophilus]|uniref:Uncharacterized protein n=1 Tax=Streptococcus thermophilus TaxID=1308 RepID=A0A8D6XPM3_STRTR|nr:protein of unknown function [Streptococcus thermophilus]